MKDEVYKQVVEEVRNAGGKVPEENPNALPSRLSSKDDSTKLKFASNNKDLSQKS